MSARGSSYSRKWRVYVIQSMHAMLGWVRSCDHAQRYLAAEIRNHLDLMDQTDGYALQEQHRYLADSAWTVRAFLNHYPEDVERLRRRLRERRLEINTFEGNINDTCFSGEELVRGFFTSASLERQGLGNHDLIVFTDIHAFTLGLPALAAGSGVRYLMVGSNNEETVGFLRYPDTGVRPRGHALFWWEGPDGRRILCFNYGSYFEASGQWDGGEFDPALLETYLQRFEAKGEHYPYDAVVLFGTGGDGLRGGDFYHTRVGTQRLSRWNREHDAYAQENLDGPLLINGCLRDFFAYVEAKYASQIPVFRGGWGAGETVWDTQAQRYGKTGLRAKKSSARILVAEALAAASTALSGAAYPRGAINEVFRHRLWHDEHDAMGDTRRTTAEVIRGWRETQQAWGLDGMERPSQEILRRSLETFAAHVPAGPQSGSHTTLMVYNPVSIPRTDLVRWPCASPGQGQTWQVTDRASKAIIPSQYVREGESVADDEGCLIFVARDLPSYGYSCFEIGDAVPVSSARTWGDGARAVVENDRFKVICGPSGAIASLWDKRLEQELVRANGGLNLYVDNGQSPSQAEVSLENAGPVAANLRIRAGMLPPETQALSSRIWLYAELDRIDLVNELELVDARHEVFFDFQMSMPQPLKFALEGPAATILTPGRQEEFDEARLVYWNAFSFVNVSALDYGVTLCTPDARQAYLGSVTGDYAEPNSDLAQPRVLIRPIGGCPPHHQHLDDDNGGPADNPYRYRFTLVSHPGPLDVRRAVADGWAALFPLQVWPVSLHEEEHPRRAVRASLWRVPLPLMISAFKQAESGTPQEFILRLWNPGPDLVMGGVESDLLRIERARGNDHAERDTGSEWPVSETGFTVEVPGWGMATVRLWLQPR